MQEEKFGPKDVWEGLEDNPKYKQNKKQPIDAPEDEEEENDEEMNEKIRQYELQKMKWVLLYHTTHARILECCRYYYAVVECDSPRTATAIYDQCDGMEILRSSNMVDLRIMPDDLVIEQPP